MDDNEQEMQAALACPHQEAVFWNPYNHVVQCHRCGLVFVPMNAMDYDQYMEWVKSQPELVLMLEVTNGATPEDGE